MMPLHDLKKNGNSPSVHDWAYKAHFQATNSRKLRIRTKPADCEQNPKSIMEAAAKAFDLS
jgi:hypothetical protein